MGERRFGALVESTAELVAAYRATIDREPMQDLFREARRIEDHYARLTRKP